MVISIDSLEYKNVPSIYKITFPNGKIYIGQTINTWRRIREYTVRNTDKYKTLIYKAIRKYGSDSFKFEILQTVKLNDSCKNKLNILEVMWIKYFNSTDLNIGYNLASGGLSFTHSDVSKEKMRDAKLGYIASDETRKKMSISKTGFKHSDETKKIIQWHSINISEERRNKLILARQKNKDKINSNRRELNNGNWFSPKGLLKMKSFKKVGEIKVLQFDKNMNYIATHKSYIKAAKSIGVNPSCISNCCNKKSKSSNGFIFVKESEYNNTSKNNKYDITINIS